MSQSEPRLKLTAGSKDLRNWEFLWQDDPTPDLPRVAGRRIDRIIRWRIRSERISRTGSEADPAGPTTKLLLWELQQEAGLRLQEHGHGGFPGPEAGLLRLQIRQWNQVRLTPLIKDEIRTQDLCIQSDCYQSAKILWHSPEQCCFSVFLFLYLSPPFYIFHFSFCLFLTFLTQFSCWLTLIFQIDRERESERER